MNLAITEFKFNPSWPPHPPSNKLLTLALLGVGQVLAVIALLSI